MSVQLSAPFEIPHSRPSYWAELKLLWAIVVCYDTSLQRLELQLLFICMLLGCFPLKTEWPQRVSMCVWVWVCTCLLVSPHLPFWSPSTNVTSLGKRLLKARICVGMWWHGVTCPGWLWPFRYAQMVGWSKALPVLEHWLCPFPSGYITRQSCNLLFIHQLNCWKLWTLAAEKVYMQQKYVALVKMEILVFFNAIILFRATTI